MARRTFLVIIILFLLVGTASADWHNSLQPKGAKGAPITLVTDGKTTYSIMVPAKATSEESKAAVDLQNWIWQMTGARLLITPDPPGASIRIETDRTMPAEGYGIRVDGSSLVLTGGGGRGVINAVYALLEEDIGCRWYTKDDTRLPKSPTLVVSVVPRTFAPRLIQRDPGYACSYDADWSLRNRTNASGAKVSPQFGGCVDYNPLFVHTAAMLLPPGQYFKSHPEYFALNADGKRVTDQLCPTDPDVQRIVTENVLKILHDNPATNIVSVSKNDNQVECHCERCNKLRAAEGSEMANQLALVNHVADAVQKHYPGVLVDTLAYLDTIPIPKTARPRPNVIIRLCNDAVGSWTHPFTPAADCEIAKLTSAWSAVHDRLFIWDYSVNFSHYLAPMPNMDIIAQDIRFWVDHHAQGVMTEGDYQGISERDEMRSWVEAKLMWDPSRALQPLIDDFIEGHYGPGAPMLAEYDRLLVQAGKDHAADLATPPGGIRYGMDSPFLSKDFLTRATSIFARAEAVSAGNDVIRRRVQRAELPILYVQCVRGPAFVGDGYAAIVDKFDRIAHLENISTLAEGAADFNAKMESWRKQIPKAAATQAAEPIVISRGPAAYTYQAFPDACRLKNGDILCVFFAGYGHVSLAADDFPLGGRICMTRSSDEGHSWSPPEVLFDDADDNRDPHIAQLDDGSVVCTFFSWHNTGTRLKSFHDFSWKTFPHIARTTGVQLVRSTDNGHTWETEPHDLFPKWVCSAPVRQLPDGTCVLGLYGEDPKTRLNIGGTTRSLDRGKTWQPSVAIQSPPGVSLDAETDVIRLTDGRLFAALRSSKADMCYSISNDEAKSWSPAIDIGFKGHCPHLLRLKTGEIILAHRVPATCIHVSRDDGKTWLGPYQIDNCIGAYPSSVELKDGSVLIVYYTEGAGSVIRARRFKLTSDGIAFLPL